MTPAGGDAAAAEVVRLTALAHGHVQAVGYRMFCRQRAVAVSRDRAVKVTGYARNVPSGTAVEVVAEGPRDLLERLLESLRQGPALSYVVKVEASWGAATREFDSFQVRF